MYKRLLITITTGSILMLSACSGGIESDLKTALNNDKERMPICGSYRPSTRIITIDGSGLQNIKIKTYPARGDAPKVVTKRGGSTPLCFGGRSVNEIVEFTTPSDFGGMKMTEVVFSYKIDFNDMARKLRIEESLQKAYAEPLQGKAVLVETSNGWRVEKISWAKNKQMGRLIGSEKYAREEYPVCALCQDVYKNGLDLAEVGKSEGFDNSAKEKTRFTAYCGQFVKLCNENGVFW